MTLKLGLKILLGVLMILAGVMHLASPANFVRIMPDYLPHPLELVYVSGVFEILGGVGLLIPQTSRAAAWGLIALYVAVFPANLNMALHGIPFGEAPTPSLLLWLRLPVQGVLILWAWWYTKNRKDSGGSRSYSSNPARGDTSP